MRFLLVLLLSLIVLTGCQSEATYTDNGNPGQIKAIVFYDDNGNGKMDGGEAGAPYEVSVTQQISCPPTSLESEQRVKADANGVALFKDLKPGKYCVFADAEAYYSSTTKLTQEVYVSSDLITTVFFGGVKR